jgi:phage-related protein
MNIFLVEESKTTRPLYLFLGGISEGLRLRIFNKFQTYLQYGDVYGCKSLKTLNARIWKYKGTIYKLRVDHGKESARVLFSKTKEGHLIIVHGFLKSTRKTPAKEAHQAIAIYQALGNLGAVAWDG